MRAPGRTATEERILSTPRRHPPTPANPGVRNGYRDMQVTALAQRMYAAYWRIPAADAEIHLPDGDFTETNRWKRVAEAAVDELIDRPEREFQAQLAAIVSADQHRTHVGTWQPATVEAWL